MKRGLFALLALLILLIVGLIGFMLGRPRSTAQAPTPTLYVIPSQQPTRSPTRTARPSRTPAPTSTTTAVLTDTPSLTPTLTTTPTAISTPTADNRLLVDYANHRDDATYFARLAKADVDVTFGKFIDGNVSQYNEMWQIEVTTYFNEFGAYLEWFDKATPPDVFLPSHSLTKSGMTACYIGFWDLYNGATTNDQTTYQRGVDYITVCNRDWNAGDYAFWDVVLAHGLTWPAMSDPTLAP